jgi:ribosomal protein L37E
MAEIIEFGGKNTLGYDHIICYDCHNPTFHIKTDYINGATVFSYFVCTECGNEIAVNLKPLWKEE